MWLALIALVIQWTAPALHGLELAHERDACAAEAAFASEGSAPAEPHAPVDHDDADCQVCLAIAQARDGTAPTLILCVIASAPIRWTEAAPPERPTPIMLGSDAFPRGPPALIAA